jgi:hypothetical protein
MRVFSDLVMILRSGRTPVAHAANYKKHNIINNTVFV